MYQDIYNCICQNTKKNKIHYPLCQTYSPTVFKIRFPKVDQHAGGKWFIHDTKRRKNNQWYINTVQKTSSLHSIVTVSHPVLVTVRLLWSAVQMHKSFDVCILMRNNLLFWISSGRSLTHWGRVTHICIDNLTIISSGNGLSPGRR